MTSFEEYWSTDKLEKDDSLITGSIRINQKNYEDAYVSHPDGSPDVYINGMRMRNRSLNGDVVYVQVLPKEQWKIPMNFLKNHEILLNLSLNDTQTDTQHEAQGQGCDAAGVFTEKVVVHNSPEGHNTGLIIKNNLAERFTTFGDIPKLSVSLQKYFIDQNNQPKFSSVDQLQATFPALQLIRTGKVVGISKKVHPRRAAGCLKLMKDKNKNKVLFVPRDSRVPRMVILAKHCPPNFFVRPGDYDKTLFIVSISKWTTASNMPLGEVFKGVGQVGEVEPETEALLLEYDVDASDFSQEVSDSLKDLPRTIPPADLVSRRDFRNKCVFTIDPATAKDLDDAVSCESLGEGLYEVGVHIADVSYYVKEDTLLDEVASQRAFSVYLVQKVIPMLPSLLCEELCSLNPGIDRMSYSVVWKMREDGSIEDEWIGRSVIRSCAKFAYKHVQGFIDEPDKEWAKEELPEIFGGYTVSKISQTCLDLYKITSNIKKERVASGSLRLDQKKLSFALCPSGFPSTVTIYERTDSHFLIEELMLRANTSVAKFILVHHPDSALLRCHPPPCKKGLENFHEFCQGMGLCMDSTSSAALQDSFAELMSTSSDDSVDKYYGVVHQCLKSMQQAVYVASGKRPGGHHHYALNIPCYTHFTSPIRRYADLLVHRQLSLALEYQPWKESILTNPILLQKQCDHVNIKKTNAKNAGDKSADLYFTLFLRQCGPINVEGVVIDLMDKSFEVMVTKFGVNKRIRLNKLPLESYTYSKEGKSVHMELSWMPYGGKKEVVRQKVNIFTQLRCRLVHAEDSFNWDIEIRHPLEE